MIAPRTNLPELLALMSDATRLRMLALLERHELPVGELARALSLSQSRVSNHLRLLREAGWLAERHNGASTFVRLRAPDGSDPLLARLWEAVRAGLERLPERAADENRLAELRAAQGGELFDRMAADWDKLGGAFESGQARQRAAVALLPRTGVYADFGCGTGYMAAALLGCCAKLVCIDRSPGMLAAARTRLEPAARGTELAFARAELDALPLPDQSLDGAIVGLVLHHLEKREHALAEVRRVLKPGAALSVLELAPHRESWMRAELGDRHLGLAARDVLDELERAGFRELSLDAVEDRYCPAPAGAKSARARLELYLIQGRA